MPLKSGKSQATISKNIETEKQAHPDMSNAQAAAIAYSNARKTGKDGDNGKTFKIYDQNGGSAREYDLNGWPEIKGNPISKVGIFDYSGAQINSELEPDKVYRVYRPKEELDNPETIESFKLLPFVDNHEMIGADDGMTPAERKGVHGVIGEDVYFADGYLKGNLKIFSNKLAELIDSGKRELSIGYRCLYDRQDGIFEGESYQFVQRNIRGNHLALVDEGRSGPDVAVLDHFKFVLDAKELQMPDMKRESEPVKDEGEWTLQDCVKAIKSLMEMSSKNKSEMIEDEEEEGKKELSEKAAEEGDAKDEEGAYKKFVNKAEVEDEEKEMKDTKEEEEMSQDAEGDTEKEKGDMSKPKDKAKDKMMKDKKHGMDAKTMFREISRRNSLASRLSTHIGTFDHSEKTFEEVARYGVKKLGLRCDAGHEVSMLEGYLSAAKTNTVSVAQDSRAQSSCIDAYLKGSN